MIGVFQKLLHILALSPIHAEANFWKTPGIGGSNGQWRVNSDSEDKSSYPLRSRRMARFAPDLNNLNNFRIMNNHKLRDDSDPNDTTSLPEVSTLSGEDTTFTETPIPIVTVLPETSSSSPTTTETTTLIPTLKPAEEELIPYQESNVPAVRQPLSPPVYYDKTPGGISPSGVDSPLSHSGFLRKMFPAMFILSAVSGFLCLYLKEVFHSNFKDADDANVLFARSGFLMWVSAWAFLSGQLFTTERDSYLIVAVSAIAFGSFFIATGFLLSAVANIIYLIFTKNELGRKLVV